MTSNAAWDPLRPSADQTGYIKRLLAVMPRANYFYQGGTAAGGATLDGLNVAGFQWTRSANGISGTGGQNATNPESVGRKQVSLDLELIRAREQPNCLLFLSDQYPNSFCFGLSGGAKTFVIFDPFPGPVDHPLVGSVHVGLQITG